MKWNHLILALLLTFTISISNGDENFPKAEGLSLHPGLEGAVLTQRDGQIHVTEVTTDSPAGLRGLRVDDVVIVVNRRPIKSLEEFQEISSNSKILFLEVNRCGKRTIVQIR